MIQALENAQRLGWPIKDGCMLQCPDGYRFRVRSVDSPCTVLGVRYACENLESARDYYVNVLGMRELAPARFGFDASSSFIELAELPFGQKIERGSSSGRLAIAVPTSKLSEFEARIAKSGDAVHTPRVSLPTPGKADVEVIIVLDRSGHEICLVGAEAFYQLCARFPGCDRIDWATRIDYGSKEEY